MKKIIIIICISFFSSAYANRAITYTLNGGRLGDALSAHCKALYFAHVNNLELYYQSFEYADQLQLSKNSQLFLPGMEKQFSSIVKVKSSEDISRNKDKDVLFISNVYAQTPGLFEYSIQDKIFDKKLKSGLQPIEPFAPFSDTFPAKTVALHVRKGGGFDQPLSTDTTLKKPFADQQWPTKFPPDSYYIQQLKILRTLLGNDLPLIIYLFTDDKNPQVLADYYQSQLNDPNTSFIFRDTENSHNQNVLEDLVQMAQCDYLVRSSSLFAKAAQLLGNHKIILYPAHGYWDGTQAIMDPLGIHIRA